MGSRNIKMGPCIKGNGLMIRRKGWGHSGISKGIFISGNSKLMRHMGLANILTRMVPSTWVSGSTIKKMGKAMKLGWMVENTSENIKME